MILTYINSGDFMYDDILQHIYNPQTLIIDLRDEFSFRQLHLKNAINIPGDDLKSQIPYLPVILEKLLKRWQNNANN